MVFFCGMLSLSSAVLRSLKETCFGNVGFGGIAISTCRFRLSCVVVTVLGGVAGRFGAGLGFGLGAGFLVIFEVGLVINFGGGGFGACFGAGLILFASCVVLDCINVFGNHTSRSFHGAP